MMWTVTAHARDIILVLPSFAYAGEFRGYPKNTNVLYGTDLGYLDTAHESAFRAITALFYRPYSLLPADNKSLPKLESLLYFS